MSVYIYVVELCFILCIYVFMLHIYVFLLHMSMYLCKQALETPLHLACREGMLSVVQTMCAFGCPVNVADQVKRLSLLSFLL